MLSGLHFVPTSWNKKKEKNDYYLLNANELDDEQLFEKDYVQRTREKAIEASKTTCTWILAAVAGILGIPFGPIGFLIMASIGSIVGYCIGSIIDVFRKNRMVHNAESEHRLLTYFIRWSNIYFSTANDKQCFVCMVILRFRYAAIAYSSNTYSSTINDNCQYSKRNLLLLSSFINRDDVQSEIWKMGIHFTNNWRTLKYDEILEFKMFCYICLMWEKSMKKRQNNLSIDLLRHIVTLPATEKLFELAELFEKKPNSSELQRIALYSYANRKSVGGHSDPQVTNLLDSVAEKAEAIRENRVEPSMAKPKEDDGLPSASNSLIIDMTGPAFDDVISEAPARGRNNNGINVESDALVSIIGKVYGTGVDTPMRKHSTGTVMSLDQFKEETPKIGKTEAQLVSPMKEIFLSVDTLSRRESLRNLTCSVRSEDSFHPMQHSSITGGQSFALPSNAEAADSPTRIHDNMIPVESYETHTLPSLKEGNSFRMTESVVPLFQSFDDMVQFDNEIKLREPIRKYEFKFLKQLQQEHPTGEGWANTVNRSDCQVFRYISETSPVVLVKANAILKNIHRNIVWWCIEHIPTRITWDRTFAEFEMIQENYEGNEIIYSMLKAPWPASNRDFCQYRRTEMHKDEIMILMRSAAHPKCPEKPNVVRANTIISGYVIKPLKNDPNSAELYILAQTDIKGLVPKVIVNTAAARAPIGWLNNLRTACEQYCSKNKNHIPLYTKNPHALEHILLE